MTKGNVRYLVIQSFELHSSLVIRASSLRALARLSGPDWKRFPEGGLCETPPVVSQLRVVVVPRGMIAQGRDLDLNSQRERESVSKSKT